MPEGALLRCTDCVQLVSQASTARYWETMAQFDRADYNDPAGDALERRIRVAQRRLRVIATLLEQEPGALRILDVGCSRGQFVGAAAALGFDAEGVEPAPHIAAPSARWV